MGYKIKSVGLVCLLVVLSGASDAIPTPRGAWSCTFDEVGKEDADTSNNVKLGILLSNTMSDVDPFEPIETADPFNLLHGKAFTAFYRLSPGHFAVVTGDPRVEGTYLLQMIPSVDGPWHHARLQRIESREPYAYTGACFGLQSPDTAADFHRMFPKT